MASCDMGGIVRLKKAFASHGDLVVMNQYEHPVMRRSSLSKGEIEPCADNSKTFRPPSGLKRGKRQGRHTRLSSTPQPYNFLKYDLAGAEYVVHRARTSVVKRGKSVAPDYDPRRKRCR